MNDQRLMKLRDIKDEVDEILFIEEEVMEYNANPEFETPITKEQMDSLETVSEKLEVF
jgi:hypothetical protein